MSNSSNDLKYNLFHNTRIKQQREVTLTKDLTKAIYEIKYDKDIWSITWRGMTFSIKPYLCSGMSFITSSDIFITLCMCVFNSDENFYENLDDYERKEYLGIFTDDENDVSDSIFYQFNSRIPCIVRYLIGLEDMTVIRKLMGFIVKEFMSIWHNCDCYIDFADNDICNTEAFSYFLSMLWVFQKSKKLQILLCKELKSLGINEILNKLCPETSLHYKYLTGEITSKELKTRYIKDGVIYKELFNLLDRGTRKYDKDLDYVHIKQTCGSLRTYYEFEDFVTEMFTQYMMSGIYHMDLKKSKMCNKQLLDYKDCNSELVRENRDLRSKAKALTKDLDKLSDKCNKLALKNDTSAYETRIKKLTSALSGIRHQASQANKSLALKDKEILSQKQVIRGQIKEIKSLKARVAELEPVTEEFTDSIADIEPELSIEEMAESLKDFKLGVFGGFDAGNLTEKFRGYDLEVKHIIDEKQFVVGDLDCAIVLTTNIQHKTVKRLKSQYNGKFIYISGTSIESMIQEAYKVLCKEDIINGD